PWLRLTLDESHSRMEGQMLLQSPETDERPKAASLELRQVMASRCGLSRSCRIHPPNLVRAGRRFACQPEPTYGNKVPVRAAALSWWYSRLHQELVHSLPRNGYPSDAIAKAPDRNRRRAGNAGGSIQPNHF